MREEEGYALPTPMIPSMYIYTLMTDSLLFSRLAAIVFFQQQQKKKIIYVVDQFCVPQTVLVCFLYVVLYRHIKVLRYLPRSHTCIHTHCYLSSFPLIEQFNDTRAKHTQQ